ncbi:hypothetical protein X551_04623 [Methylibium sp. T29]|nr:hypothetical protein X551_04623 [Methylibium sp. T29]
MLTAAPPVPARQRLLLVLLACRALRQPGGMAAGGAGDEIQPGHVPPQHALLAMLDQRIEQAVAREQLARVLLHPQPRAHLQRQRQEHALGMLLAGAQIEVVPQVAVRQVLAALRLEHVAVVSVRLVEQDVQRMHLRQVRDRPCRVGVGKPDAVVQAEARVAVDRDAEAPRQQLLLHHAAQRLALGLHRGAQRAAVPRQAGAEPLAAHQEGRAIVGVDRRIAHQVHALRVGARAAPQAARIDQRHEHQAQHVELAVQQHVPRQAVHHAAQAGQHHLGADPLQPVHAAEEAHRRQRRIGVAQRDGVNRQAEAVADAHLAHHALLQVRAALLDDALQFGEFGQFRRDHSAQSGHGNPRIAAPTRRHGLLHAPRRVSPHRHQGVTCRR